MIVKGETPETGFAHQKHSGHFSQISSKNVKSSLEKRNCQEQSNSSDKIDLLVKTIRRKFFKKRLNCPMKYTYAQTTHWFFLQEQTKLAMLRSTQNSIQFSRYIETRVMDKWRWFCIIYYQSMTWDQFWLAALSTLQPKSRLQLYDIEIPNWEFQLLNTVLNSNTFQVTSSK